MPRNILCFIICAITCLMLVGCVDESDSEGEKLSPSISTTLGENPTLSLKVGESQTVCFRAVTDEPLFQGDLSLSLSDTHIADVEYVKISGEYVYYNVTAKASGTLNLRVEIPALELNSETVKIQVTEEISDKIYTSLGETLEISVVEESSDTVWFIVDEDIASEDLIPVIADPNLIKVELEKSSGEYFYYKISGLVKGSTTFYLNLAEHGVSSEIITVNVIQKGTSSGTEETTVAYIANSNSGNFHLPTCTFANNIMDQNKVVFYSGTDRQAVIDEGYDPCGHCKP